MTRPMSWSREKRFSCLSLRTAGSRLCARLPSATKVLIPLVYRGGVGRTWAGNTGNLSTREIDVKVSQVFLKFFQSFALRHVIGRVLEIAEPHAMVLPGMCRAVLMQSVYLCTSPFYMGRETHRLKPVP